MEIFQSPSLSSKHPLRSVLHEHRNITTNFIHDIRLILFHRRYSFNFIPRRVATSPSLTVSSYRVSTGYVSVLMSDRESARTITRIHVVTFNGEYFEVANFRESKVATCTKLIDELKNWFRNRPAWTKVTRAKRLEILPRRDTNVVFRIYDVTILLTAIGFYRAHDLYKFRR